MIKVFHLRVLIDYEDDVFRDIAILGNQNFEDLHNQIMEAFGFDGKQMASFYLSDEQWSKGEEIALWDITDEIGKRQAKVMKETAIQDILKVPEQKMLYVFDFMLMWMFYIEVTRITEQDKSLDYPVITTNYGTPPEQYSKEIDLNVSDDDFLGGNPFEAEDDVSPLE